MLSTLKPIILQSLLLNSLVKFDKAPNSVVHTGVKSLGWENSSTQLLPIQSWKLILPIVVSTLKSGAKSLIL